MSEKPIRFSGHARYQMERRGATQSEVVEAIRQREWQPSRHGRWECRMNFPFNSEWNGRWYRTKQVRPIFVEEEEEIVVVTVYTYYF